jgi:hypothetical protein
VTARIQSGEALQAFYEAAARVNLGILKVVKGAMDRAANDFRAALVPTTELRSTYLVVSCLDGLAAAEREDEPDRAAFTLSVSDSLRRRTGPPRIARRGADV